MSIIKICDRCGGKGKQGIISDGFSEISFPKVGYNTCLYLKEKLDLCNTCIEKFLEFLKNNK